MRIPIPYSPSVNQKRNNILGISGTLQSEEEQLVSKIKENFQRSLDYTPVNKNFDNTVIYDTWIFDENKVDKSSDDYKVIYSYPYSTIQFEVGDYISFECDNVVSNWLIMSLDKKQYYDVKGNIKECNSTLTLVTSTVETITGYGTSGRPIITKTNTTTTWNCIVETKVFSADMNSQINLPKGEIKVTIPYSALVLEGMEFSMWGNDYKITGLDLSKVISSVGVLSISAEKVVI